MSDGLFLLLLAAVGFGVRQLTLAIPIPEAAVRRYVEQQRPHELLPMQHGPTEEDDWFVKRSESRPRKSEHGLKWIGCSDGRG